MNIEHDMQLVPEHERTPPLGNLQLRNHPTPPNQPFARSLISQAVAVFW